MAKWTRKSYEMCVEAPADGTSGASQTAAAAAVNALTITHDGTNILQLNGFHITTLAPAGTVGGLVTITGLVGGTLSYQFVESATFGGALQESFSNPIPAVDANTDIVITLAAITSGAASAVTAYYSKSQW